MSTETAPKKILKIIIGPDGGNRCYEQAFELAEQMGDKLDIRVLMPYSVWLHHTQSLIPGAGAPELAKNKGFYEFCREHPAFVHHQKLTAGAKGFITDFAAYFAGKLDEVVAPDEGVTINEAIARLIGAALEEKLAAKTAKKKTPTPKPPVAEDRSQDAIHRSQLSKREEELQILTDTIAMMEARIEALEGNDDGKEERGKWQLLQAGLIALREVELRKVAPKVKAADERRPLVEEDKERINARDLEDEVTRILKLALAVQPSIDAAGQVVDWVKEALPSPKGKIMFSEAEDPISWPAVCCALFTSQILTRQMEEAMQERKHDALEKLGDFKRDTRHILQVEIDHMLRHVTSQDTAISEAAQQPTFLVVTRLREFKDEMREYAMTQVRLHFERLRNGYGPKINQNTVIAVADGFYKGVINPEDLKALFEAKYEYKAPAEVEKTHLASSVRVADPTVYEFAMAWSKATEQRDPLAPEDVGGLTALMLVMLEFAKTHRVDNRVKSNIARALDMLGETSKDVAGLPVKERMKDLIVKMDEMGMSPQELIAAVLPGLLGKRPTEKPPLLALPPAITARAVIAEDLGKVAKDTPKIEPPLLPPTS
ncbi:MAG: hypothetical protein EB060_08390 [Proteobacteria bacterium]|nr:hypothetical protein [Pseudomonadota bacterium]